MQSFPTEATTFLLPGEAGAIEVLTTSVEGATKTSIICHPHPLYGGTMHNKVVTTLARAMNELGLRTVRFNFRGIGKTEGAHDAGHGETDDVVTIANWLNALYPNDELWLAGFSFGGFVAAKAATRLAVTQLITIAPQVSRFLSETLPPITCPWLIIQGEEDEIIPPEDVFSWAGSLQPPPQVVRFPKTGHFFHGQLGALRQALIEALSNKI